MRDVSTQFLAAVLGSNKPVIVADIVLEGEVIRSNAQIVGGVVEFDSGRDVEGRLSGCVVVDDDATGSALSQRVHAIGTQVNIKAGFDMAGVVETVSLGWFDVTVVETSDEWLYVDWQTKPIKGRSFLTIDGLDLMSVVARSEFLEPVQPTAGADAWTTINTLCRGIVPVLNPGFAAKTIPSTGIVFEWSRLDAIKEIAKLWDAWPMMTADGQLTLATTATGDTIAPFGAKVNIAAWQDSIDSSELFNGVTAIGKSATTQVQLVGSATEVDGLARWGGPFGFRPRRESSDVWTTQAAVDAAAAALLAQEITGRAVVQKVEALWNPAVECRDITTVSLPDRTVASKVLGYELPLAGGPMTVTLRLPMTL